MWVVDNASSDGSVAAVRARFPNARIIANPANTGFAAANNQAIAASDGRYVLLLNSDTVAPPGSIERLVRFADAHPRAAIVGPQLRNGDGSFQGSCAGAPTLLSEALSVTGLGVRIFGAWYPNYSPRRGRHAQQAGYVQGACMLARRAAIDAAGLLDEGYFMYSEETDWCLRMQRAGWQVWFTPDAAIVHYGGQSTRHVQHAMVQALLRSKIRFFRKYYGPLQGNLLQALFVAARRTRRLGQAARRVVTPSAPLDPPIRWRDLQTRG